MKTEFVLLHNNLPIGVYSTEDKVIKAKEEYLNTILKFIGPGEGYGNITYYEVEIDRKF